MIAPRDGERCDRCQRHVAARYELLGGHICNACYSRLRRHPGTCPGCNATRVLAFLDDTGQTICAGCAGQPGRFGCKRCGSEELLTGSHCGRCRLDERLQDLLADDDGAIRPPFDALHIYLTSAELDPRSVVRWLRQEPISHALSDMSKGKLELSHNALLSLSPSRRVTYLRRILVESGVLPPVDLLLSNLGAFVHEFAEVLPPAHGSLIRQYYRWHILPTVQRRAGGNALSRGSYDARRSELRKIAAFLSWLEQRGTTLEALEQRTIDRYTVEDTSPEIVHPFLRWAMKRGTAPAVRIDRRSHPPAPSLQDEDEIWALTDRLLTDTSIELPIRIIGLFVLLYAQQVVRVARLTREQVAADEDAVAVRFATTPVVLPRPLANLVIEHLATPPRRGFANGESEWVFEGLHPGQPITPAYVLHCFRAIGLPALTARSTRLDLLAQALSASVVADTLGVNTITASQRRGKAGGTWSEYPTLRAE